MRTRIPPTKHCHRTYKRVRMSRGIGSSGSLNASSPFPRCYTKLLLDVTSAPPVVVHSVTLIDESVPRKPAARPARCRRRFYLFLSIAPLLGISRPMLYGEKVYCEYLPSSVELEKGIVAGREPPPAPQRYLTFPPSYR